MPTVYRSCRHNPPERGDFQSDKDAGIPQGPTQSDEGWGSISTFKSAQLCKKKGLKHGHGPYIVEFIIEDDTPIRVGHISKNGHINVIGDPEEFVRLALAAKVVHRDQVED